MKLKKDHRNNPTYNETECLIMLYVYTYLVYLNEQKRPSSKHPIVKFLSEFLNELCIHNPENRVSTFRNENGILMELGQIHSVIFNKGLSSTNKLAFSAKLLYSLKKE